jgi:hypothetical protein
MSESTLPPPSDEDARRQRQEALRTLAQSQAGSPAATTPGRTPSASRVQARRQGTTGRTRTARRQPPWLIVVSAVIALLVRECALLA